MHTHDLPHVGVILTAGELVFTEAGKSETTRFEVEAWDTEPRMSRTRSQTRVRHRCA